MEYLLQQATKQVLEIYPKNPQFSQAIDEEWHRHLRQFLQICAVYKDSDDDRVIIFGHSHAPYSSAHQI